MKIILITVCTFVLFSSCSFNKVFLQPTELDEATKSVSRNTKEGRITIAFSGTNHQPVYLQNTDTLQLDYTIESVLFESTSGNTLNGWLIRSKTVKPSLTLLHFHGNAGCLPSQVDLISPMLAHGFQVFLFDYSGFGFSEGRATRKNVLKDAHSALDYLKTRPELKNTKLLIYGQSLGGHLSASIAASRQNEIDGLVVEGAFSSHKDAAKHFAGGFGKMMVSEKYSGKEEIQKFKKPLLVVHSTQDKVIPFEMGKRIYEHANEPKTFYQIEGDHLYGPTLYAEEIARRIRNMVGEK